MSEDQLTESDYTLSESEKAAIDAVLTDPMWVLAEVYDAVEAILRNHAIRSAAGGSS